MSFGTNPTPAPVRARSAVPTASSAADRIRAELDRCVGNFVSTEHEWAPRTSLELRYDEAHDSLGLWARDVIPAGAVVTEYTGVKRLGPVRDTPSTHLMKVPGTDVGLDGLPLRAALLANLAEADVRTVGAFINSSSRPDREGEPGRYENLARRWTGPGQGCRLFFVAARDIRPGEELLYFYKKF
jgi:hypothetical protein